MTKYSIPNAVMLVLMFKLAFHFRGFEWYLRIQEALVLVRPQPPSNNVANVNPFPEALEGNKKKRFDMVASRDV